MTQPSRYFSPLVFACWVLVVTGCSTVSNHPSFRPRQTILAADRVALPTFSNRFRMLEVDVRINGAGPFRLLLDTGCDTLVLARHVADAVGLKTLSDRTLQVRGAVADDVSGRVMLVEHLESGGLKLADLAAVVLDDADLANGSAAVGARMEGVLGMAALKDLVLEMDFPGEQVTVVKRGAGSYPADRAVTYEGNTPKVTVDVGGKSIVALIDTGSASGLDIPQLEAVPLLYPKIHDDGGIMGVGKQVMRGESSQLAGEARLGPVTWVNPPIGKDRKGNIGIAALNSWKLAIDQHAHRIYFLGAETRVQWDEQKQPEMRFQAGFFATLHGTGFRLIEVDSGGAYDLAGLRVGDVILTVDGALAGEYLTGHVTQEVKNNKWPKLRVRRDGEEFETRLILAEAELPLSK